MMRSVWRVLLIWLVVAVLPFKAVGGVTMAGCGPVHEAARTQAVELPVHAAHQGDVAEDEGHAAHHLPADTTNLTDLDAETASSGGTAKVKCSSCAPCCAAVAPAFPSRALPGFAAGSSEVVSFLIETYAGVVADVPRRPPREILV
jgi:hypothetical protein